MAKYPKKPEEIFPEFTRDMVSAFGNDLQAILLYGSGARGDYIPGKSDLNFLVVLSEGGIDSIDRALQDVARWRKRMVATPLFMTRAFICASADAFPVEFFTMQRSHVLVHGEDVLKDLEIDPGNLRLQCERELSGKLLLLRTSFFETGGKAARIRRLIEASIPAFTAISQALLHLRGLEIPGRRREILRAAAEAFGLSTGVFIGCLDVKEGRDRLSDGEIKGLFREYLKEVRKLAEAVDSCEAADA